MTKKEVLEIRHQFAQATCSIDKICGCYVDGDGRKIATMKEAFLSLPEEEAFKYFEIFKKNLSGSIGKNLITMPFPTDSEFDGGTQEFLLKLRNSKLEDDELIAAFLDMVENHKMIVENSGLLTVAALNQLKVKGKRVVSILSGGNMDVITMSSVVQQGLIFRDRIFTVSVLLPDKPGELARVADTIAKVQGNVIKLEHNQFVSTNRNAAVELRITLEAFGTEHKSQIIEALEKGGYQPKIVRTSL